MKRIELPHSPVEFYPDEHRYFLDGLELSGITGAISRQLMPNAFDNIPEKVLAASCEYGHAVHSALEAYDMTWTSDGSQEVLDYISLCRDYGLVHEASEYLVSDAATSDSPKWASCIDKVFRDGPDTFSLGDIKTVSAGSLDDAHLLAYRFQLSIYAMFFEKQVKGAKVNRLFLLHIRNRNNDHFAEYIPLERIAPEICQELLDADLNGEQFANPFGIPESIRIQESLIRQLLAQKQEVEEKIANVKQGILTAMNNAGVHTWCTDTMRLTRKLPSTRTSFSLPLFKQANPDFDTTPYLKTSQVAESLTITI